MKLHRYVEHQRLHIFTNFPEDREVRAGTLPVYYSDHIIIWAAIKSLKR